jgi:hypothetical protein
MSEKKPAVGDPIESRCTKCRKITNHIIVAIVDDAPKKVQCNTCDGQHNYRPPTVRKKAAGRKPVDPSIAEQAEWQELRSTIEGKQAIDYSMTNSFKVGSVVKHAKFGLGLVQRSLGSQKIEVLFEDGKKKMRCL